MADQMRFDTGKAKLSYIAVNAQALRLMRFSPGAPSFDTVAAVVSEYLARETIGTIGLAMATGCCLQALEIALGGDAGDQLWYHARALDAVCAVYEAGAKKYARGNYRLGQTITHYLDSFLRHYRAYARGEAYDPESGQHHGAHMFWNLFQALDQPACRDDRLPAVQYSAAWQLEQPQLGFDPDRVIAARGPEFKAVPSEDRPKFETIGDHDMDFEFDNDPTYGAGEQVEVEIGCWPPLQEPLEIWEFNY